MVFKTKLNFSRIIRFEIAFDEYDNEIIHSLDASIVEGVDIVLINNLIFVRQLFHCSIDLSCRYSHHSWWRLKFLQIFLYGCACAASSCSFSCFLSS